MKGSTVAVVLLFIAAHATLVISFPKIMKFSIENGYVDAPSNYDIYKDKI